MTLAREPGGYIHFGTLSSRPNLSDIRVQMSDKFEEMARFVMRVAREDPSGDDLVTLCLVAMHMLPENVRLRSARSTPPLERRRTRPNG